MTNSKPHVAIVGGGIGGLFAANALVAEFSVAANTGHRLESKH